MSDFNINIKQTRTGDSIKDTLQDLKTIKTDGTEAMRTLGAGSKMTEGQLAGAARSAAAMAQAVARGNVTFGEMMSLSRGLGGALGGMAGQLGLVGAGIALTVAAGKAFGTVAANIYGALKDTDNAAVDNASSFREMRHALEELDKQKLSKLKEELQELDTIASRLMSKIDKRLNREGVVAKSEFAVQRAQAELMPDGPDKIRALAQIDSAEKFDEADRQTKQADLDIKANKRQFQEAGTKLQRLQDAVVTAQTPWEKKAAKERLDAAKPEIEKALTASSDAITEAESRKTVAKNMTLAAGYGLMGSNDKAENLAAQERERILSSQDAAEKADLELKLQEAKEGTSQARADLQHANASGLTPPEGLTVKKGAIGGPSIQAQRDWKNQLERHRQAVVDAERHLNSMVGTVENLTKQIRIASAQIKNANRMH